MIYKKGNRKSQKAVFKRSIEDHIEYYRNKSIEEKLLETIKISDFCMRFAESAKKAGFSGK